MIATIKNSSLSDDRLADVLHDTIVGLLLQAYDDGKGRRGFSVPDIDWIVRGKVAYAEKAATDKAATHN